MDRKQQCEWGNTQNPQGTCQAYLSLFNQIHVTLANLNKLETVKEKKKKTEKDFFSENEP